jgi:hypothetical protein
VLGVLAAQTLVPAEKYIQPVTTAMEIGWMNKEYAHVSTTHTHTYTNSHQKYPSNYTQVRTLNPVCLSINGVREDLSQPLSLCVSWWGGGGGGHVTCELTPFQDTKKNFLHEIAL